MFLCYRTQEEESTMEAMQRFYTVKTSAGNELWQLIVRKDRGVVSTGFECPKCYFVVPVLGGGHDCPVSSGKVYQCLRCHRDVHPPHTLGLLPMEAYYNCYWCCQVIRNTLARQADHARRCQNRPPQHLECKCGPLVLI